MSRVDCLDTDIGVFLIHSRLKTPHGVMTLVESQQVSLSDYAVPWEYSRRFLIFCPRKKRLTPKALWVPSSIQHESKKIPLQTGEIVSVISTKTI